MKTILFLCHGNICRSPAAKFIFDALIIERGLTTKYRSFSRALSYEEIGNDIYPPMKAALKRAQIPFGPHAAQIVNQAEAEQSDVIFYMDEENRFRIRRYIHGCADRIKPLYAYLKSPVEIEDPWYTGRFDWVVTQIKRALNAYLDEECE